MDNEQFSQGEPFRARLFDRNQEFDQDHSHLPHRDQIGTITFITLRLIDSLPRDVIIRWNREKTEFLRSHGINCGRWQDGTHLLSDSAKREFYRRFNRASEMELDKCHGACLLQDPLTAQLVRDSLLYFDNERYQMGDLIIMPNHVHLLVAFMTQSSLRTQCTSWMRFTALGINQRLRRSGPVWQCEPFDHLIRSETQLSYLRKYICENPQKANLNPGSYLYRKSNRFF